MMQVGLYEQLLLAMMKSVNESTPSNNSSVNKAADGHQHKPDAAANKARAITADNYAADVMEQKSVEDKTEQQTEQCHNLKLDRGKMTSRGYR